MNAPLAVGPSDPLPVLIDRACAALDSARTSAEVLEARDLARLAYDAARSAARMAKVKQAHDSLVAEVHRAQGEALAIRARAEIRLAEEYDAAQDRGEVSRQGAHVVDGNMRTADLGLRRDEIHEARRFRDAETAAPGSIERAIGGMIERGEEPTRAALKRSVTETPQPKKVMDPRALWLWGRIKDFERDGVLDAAPAHLLAEMTEPMRADMRAQLPDVIAFLTRMEADL